LLTTAFHLLAMKKAIYIQKSYATN